jgi:hypothetical protein
LPGSWPGSALPALREKDGTWRLATGIGLVFPSPAMLAQAHYFMRLPPALAAIYNTRFATVIGF